MQSVSRMSDSDIEAQFMGSASSRRTMSTMEERHKDQLRKVEKERKDAQEVLTSRNLQIIVLQSVTKRNFKYQK